MLTDDSTGARTARLTAVKRTGRENPGMPAGRDDDRLLVVTEGGVTAEIAGRPAAVPAEAVMVIPARVSARESLGFRGSGCPLPGRYLRLTRQPENEVYVPGAPVWSLTGLGEARMTSLAERASDIAQDVGRGAESRTMTIGDSLSADFRRQASVMCSVFPARSAGVPSQPLPAPDRPIL